MPKDAQWISNLLENKIKSIVTAVEIYVGKNIKVLNKLLCLLSSFVPIMIMITIIVTVIIIIIFLGGACNVQNQQFFSCQIFCLFSIKMLSVKNGHVQI